MQLNPDRLSVFFAAIYTWLVTLLFGAVLLDRIYASQLPGGAAAFSAAADFLLLVSAVTLLAGLAAVAGAWKSRPAFFQVLASFVILLSQFLVPLIFSSSVPDGQGSGFGPSLRLLIHGSASILAFIGLHQLYRQPK